MRGPKRRRVDEEGERIRVLEGRLKGKGKGKGEEDGLDALLEGITAAEVESEGSDAEEQEHDEEEGEGEGKEREKENIYSTGRYVPPSKRVADKEVDVDLRRQLQGLLNRLSEANMGSILAQVMALYRAHPRADVTSSLTSLLLAAVYSRAQMLDAFLILHAAFIRALHQTVGVDFAARFVQTLVETFEEYYRTAEASKECVNLVALVTELYTFQTISCVLVYDLVRQFLADMTEGNTELLLKVLRSCGPQLRADDPAALREIVSMAQTAHARHTPLSARAKFLMEAITDLKNNKARARKTASAVSISEATTRMKKFLGTLGGKSAVEPLRVTLEDVRSVKSKGKWWLPGASWQPEAHASVQTDEGGTSASLVSLAKEQRMNTDVRMGIFVAIMSAEDCMDAMNKLNRLDLRRAQVVEIPRVLVQCCATEKTYNPYYRLLAQKLCVAKRRMWKSFEFALWGTLEQMEGEEEGGGDPRRITNLAKFYGQLMAASVIPVTCLKVVTFTTMTANMQVFMEVLFLILLTTPASISTRDHDEHLFGEVRRHAQLHKGLLWYLRKRLQGSGLLDDSARARVRTVVHMLRQEPR